MWEHYSDIIIIPQGLSCFKKCKAAGSLHAFRLSAESVTLEVICTPDSCVPDSAKNVQVFLVIH